MATYKVRKLDHQEQMGQSIEEWTKQNLWTKAFKKFEAIWSA